MVAICTWTGTPHRRSVALKARLYCGRSARMAQALSRLLGGGPLRPPTPQDATSNRITIARRGLLICLSLSFLYFSLTLTQTAARGNPQLHELRRWRTGGFGDCHFRVHRLFPEFFASGVGQTTLETTSLHR